MGESDNLEDMYRFKTPSLRNVSLTKPYGHNGAYPTLKGIVKHHLKPIEMYNRWKPAMANLPKAGWLEDIDFIVFSDKREQQRLIKKIDIDEVELTDKEVDAIISFLYSLTGKTENTRPLGKPSSVPSGFLVD